MPEINEQELSGHIKSGKFSRVYLIYGPESYLKQHYVNQIISKTVPKAMEVFNFQKFDGKNISMDDFSDTVEAFPMMHPVKCVLIRDLNFEGMLQSEWDKLKEILKDPPEYAVIVFWMDSLDFNEKKSAKFKALMKIVNGCGDSVKLMSRSDSALIKILCDGAKRRGCILNSSAASYLISYAGNDMQTLLNELDKLCCYMGSGEITKKEIQDLAIRSFEASVFDLGKALTKKDGDSAFQILHELFLNREEPVMILGVLATVYLDMYRMKVAVNESSGAQEISRVFDYKGKEFRLRNAARDVPRLSIKQLSDCINILFQYDIQLKSARTDRKLILEESIIKLLQAVS